MHCFLRVFLRVLILITLTLLDGTNHLIHDTWCENKQIFVSKIWVRSIFTFALFHWKISATRILFWNEKWNKFKKTENPVITYNTLYFGWYRPNFCILRFMSVSFSFGELIICNLFKSIIRQSLAIGANKLYKYWI